MANIIIVEDEAIVAMESKLNLHLAGHYIVAVVSSAEAAIKAFVSQKPDLLLMDIQLKGEMDGIAAMTIIRQQSNVPVIFLSGNSDARTRARVGDITNASFLQKPILTAEIVDEINKVLSKN